MSVAHSFLMQIGLRRHYGHFCGKWREGDHCSDFFRLTQKIAKLFLKKKNNNITVAEEKNLMGEIEKITKKSKNWMFCHLDNITF